MCIKSVLNEFFNHINPTGIIINIISVIINIITTVSSIIMESSNFLYFALTIVFITFIAFLYMIFSNYFSLKKQKIDMQNQICKSILALTNNKNNLSGDEIVKIIRAHCDTIINI